jgi:glycosyltransferase involved in cell wall biosynthesis
VTPAGTSLAPGVLALVAARDEVDGVARTISGLCELPDVDRIVVVDDGSSDATCEAALSAGATVVRSPRNVGKGGALEAALGRLPVPGTYVLVDADVGETAACARVLIDAVRDGLADLAIGRLPRAERGGFGLVKRMSAALIERASGFRPTEPISGQRAIRGDALQACRPLARGFGVETGMTIDAVRLGYRVIELDVAMRHRPTGKDLAGFVHRGRQGVQIAAAGLVRVTGLR